MIKRIRMRLYFLVVIVIMKFVCVFGKDYFICFLFMLILKKLFLWIVFVVYFSCVVGLIFVVRNLLIWCVKCLDVLQVMKLLIQIKFVMVINRGIGVLVMKYMMFQLNRIRQVCLKLGCIISVFIMISVRKIDQFLSGGLLIFWFVVKSYVMMIIQMGFRNFDG